MHDDIVPAYDHLKHESALYLMWEKNHAFQPNFSNSKSQTHRLPSTWHVGQVNSKQIPNNKAQSLKRDDHSLEFRTSSLGLPYFSMVMPPPNANGSLHIGHAVFVTLEDIMVRYHRMKGDLTLWLPGADHAGFETQVVYQKKLEKDPSFAKAKEGKRSREETFQDILAFTLANKENMENQLRRLGASCDWTRAKFTLDDDIIKIVYQTFKELYDDGLVYRDSKIINWCTKHQTTLSDLEITHEDRASELYEIKYDDITVATTRPETMFGDVAVAVNPADKRFKHLIGTTVIQPLTNRELPVIADELVDREFGTGALKITPAHDGTDYDIGKKHSLAMDHTAFDFFGKLGGNWVPIKYHNLKGEEARKKVIDDLEKLGLLTRKPYKNSVAVCYKCHKTIEPMVLPQWFIAMTKKTKSEKLKAKNYGVASPQSRNEGKSLQELGIEAVKSGEVKFVTKKFEKIYLHWLENLRDWNISRQIVWGIRIPAWYCENYLKSQMSNVKSADEKSKIGDGISSEVATCPVGPRQNEVDSSEVEEEQKTCQPIITAGETPDKCPTCGSTQLTQDPDVFDTWFSSGQWTFAPLMTTNSNHPELKERSRDFETFYPTTVMETGHDILFFWVARMIMLGKYKTGKAPFKYVYLHGLVRDKDRQKMSKSKGNVVDPLGVIDQYGADALRMALVFGVSAGNDIVISEEKIKGMRNFSNKVWNIARFVISNLETLNSKSEVLNKSQIQNSKLQTDADKVILQKLEQTEKSVKKDIENFRFHEAAQTLYQFIWHDFADIYIEVSKKQLEDKDLSLNTYFILLNTVKVSLKLLHPFMPFVTEAVWQEMVARKLVSDKMLITSNS